MAMVPALVPAFITQVVRMTPCFKPLEVNLKRLNEPGSYWKYESLGPQVVPCGSCIGCRAEQSRQWAVRMMHETRMHFQNHFLTLTLDDEHLNENHEVSAKDFSRFIKSLRKTQEERISFFGCGEYGGITGRPHYHALLFGFNVLDKRAGIDPGGREFYRSEAMDAIWERGHVEVGTVTMASASYVAGYIGKKVKAKDFVRAHPKTGVLKAPEFARMSLRPALGRNWIEKYWRDVYPRDFVVVDGIEAKPPRYYDKYMDLLDEKGGSRERRLVMEAVRTQRYLDAVDLTPMQLTAGEAIAKGRAKVYSTRSAI